MSSSLRIIVTGLIAQHPLMGGVTWDYLQYLIGLRQLGHDVYYFEDSGEWPYNTDGGASGDHWAAEDSDFNIAFLARTMERFGLRDKWAYHCAIQSKWFGLSDIRRSQVLHSADLLLNVSGTLEWREEYRSVRRLAYIDSDPVFTQVKLALGKSGCSMPEQTTKRAHEVVRQVLKDSRTLCDRVAAHDVLFSFGEDLRAGVPETGNHWHPTRQPIVLSEWSPSRPFRNVFTTVMNWTSYEPLRYRGISYGQKDLELKRFLDLPRRGLAASLEVALSQFRRHEVWESDDDPPRSGSIDTLPEISGLSPACLLTSMGWRVVDPLEVCPDIDRYRSYIESSLAEWSVAKNGYVVGQPGWFSCRSACYLAAGRPVVVQETGFSRVLPVGVGLLSFMSLDDAEAGMQEVQANYPRHSEAARAIAETYFDSDKVLNRLLDAAIRA